MLFLAWITVAVCLTLVLGLTTYVQLLYLESLRLRTRESPAMEHFKEELEDRIGLKGDRGVLVFSLVKHTTLLLLGIVMFTIAGLHANPIWQGLAEAAVGSWLIMVTASYIIPPTLYKRTSGRFLLPVLPVVKFLALLVRPLVAALELLQSLAELGQRQEAGEDTGNPTEHIDALIAAGAEEGIIEEEDRRLIQSVVAFGDKRVREVMTPRPNVVAISQDCSLDQLRQLVINEQYSRIPVYEGNIDHIVGFVHVRDVFELDADARRQRKVKELVRTIRFVPETKPVDGLLREMQADRAHIAIVVDEYGNTAGLVTMEDMVEEILGEIRDEYEPTRDVIPESDQSYIVSGSFDVDNLHDLIEYRPESETASTTVGGLVTEWLGRVPAAGEAVERDGVRLEVLAGNDLRVEKVRISKTAPEKHDERNGNG